jgi:hypothetical protein
MIRNAKVEMLRAKFQGHNERSAAATATVYIAALCFTHNQVIPNSNDDEGGHSSKLAHMESLSNAPTVLGRLS